MGCWRWNRVVHSCNNCLLFMQHVLLQVRSRVRPSHWNSIDLLSNAGKTTTNMFFILIKSLIIWLDRSALPDWADYVVRPGAKIAGITGGRNWKWNCSTNSWFRHEWYWLFKLKWFTERSQIIHSRLRHLQLSIGARWYGRWNSSGSDHGRYAGHPQWISLAGFPLRCFEWWERSCLWGQSDPQ